MNRIRWYGPSLVLLITVVSVMVTGPWMVRHMAWAQADARITLAQNSLQQNETLAQLSDAFRKVATVVEPSVVHVQVLSRARGQAPDRQDLLRRFFGPELQPFQMPEQQAPQQDNRFEEYDPARPSGNGSGWVYDTEGHIITNNHVIENADVVRVKFQDGSEYDAEVLGTDPATDVAVLKIEASNLHPAVVAQNNVEAGDMVFAFGSPFGFDFSMSQGIVSAKGRKLGIIGGNSYENFIQTDAAINPGNSGGPLTNIYGEVIGMNTAIASRTGVYNGLGFAIPVGMVRQVADQLIQTGAVSRGYLGVYIDDLEPKMAQTFGYEGEGVLVVEPTEQGSPADEAGVQSGDIITQVNGQAVASADQLRYLIAGMPPGADVELTLFRNGETLTRTVTLGELPTQGMARSSTTPRETQEDESRGMEVLQKFGIQSVQEFNEQLAQRLGVEFQPGVLINSVRRGSIAATEGLDRGMLITNVQGQAVETVDSLVDSIEQHDATRGIRVKVLIYNPTTQSFSPRFVLLQLPE